MTYNFAVVLVCGGEITSDQQSGLIQSPGFGNGTYAPSVECIWILRNVRPENFSLSFRFTNLSIERHGECLWDFVEIREGKKLYYLTFIGTCHISTFIRTPLKAYINGQNKPWQA